MDLIKEWDLECGIHAIAVVRSAQDAAFHTAWDST